MEAKIEMKNQEKNGGTMSFKTIYTGNMSSIIQIKASFFLRLGNLPVRDQCNTGILISEDGIILVDFPEQHPSDEIISEVESLFQKKVTHIFFTHAHGDHRNGLSGLRRSDILLLASGEGAGEIRKCYPDLSNPFRTFCSGDSITVGGISFHVVIPKRLPAHSPWDMLIFCDTYDILFTGDFLNPPDTLYFHSSNYKNWAEALAENWASFDGKLLIPGHGMPWTVQEARRSFSYISELGALFEALQKKGINGDSVAGKEDLLRLFPEERERICSLERAASGQHLLRQLREITRSAEENIRAE